MTSAAARRASIKLAQQRRALSRARSHGRRLDPDRPRAGAIAVFIIEREFVKAAAFALAGAVLTYFGFMHGEAVGIGGGFGVTPGVALRLCRRRGGAVRDRQEGRVHGLGAGKDCSFAGRMRYPAFDPRRRPAGAGRSRLEECVESSQTDML